MQNLWVKKARGGQRITVSICAPVSNQRTDKYEMRSIDKARKAAVSVVKRLRRAGYDALFAGGCVRDLLMKREPSDFDVATSAPPEKVMDLFDRTVPVGISFGVVLVLKGDIKIEVATFRADGAYLDGRRPESVTFCDASGDAIRRDFTINAMFYDPLDDQLMDHVGGRRDIEAHLIQTVGDPRERFGEDHLRMLRAARLATILNFSIDKKTEEAIRALAPNIASVSGERIRDELIQIMASHRRSDGIRHLDRLNLLGEILPEVTALKGVKQSPTLHPEGDVYEHTLLVLEQLGETNVRTAMSALLHDIGKPAAHRKCNAFYGHEIYGAETARDVCRRLKLSRSETDCICWTIAKHLTFKDARQMKESTLRRLLGHECFQVLLELHRADSVASTGNLSNHEFVRAKLEEYASEPILPPPLLRGDDLLALGVEQGPLMGEILRKVTDAQLEGRLTDMDGAIAYAKKVLKNRA